MCCSRNAGSAGVRVAVNAQRFSFPTMRAKKRRQTDRDLAERQTKIKIQTDKEFKQTYGQTGRDTQRETRQRQTDR